MLLHAEDLKIFYGPVEAIHGISFDVNEGEIVSIVGNNGAGKTTILKTISGLKDFSKGDIQWQGKSIKGMGAAALVKAGIAHTPEGRMVFPNSTVYENLLSGAFIRKDKEGIKKDIEMLKQILSRGGIVSMSNVMFTLIIGMSLGGLLNGLSIFGTLADAIIRRIDRFRAKDLVLISSLLSLMGYAITGDSQPTKMLVSNAFRDVYAQKKIDCGVLSRTLDIAGFGEGIFPWTVGGTYFATLFNVSVGRYWYLVFFYYFAIAFNVHTVGRLKSKRYSL